MFNKIRSLVEKSRKKETNRAHQILGYGMACIVVFLTLTCILFRNEISSFFKNLGKNQEAPWHEEELAEYTPPDDTEIIKVLEYTSDDNGIQYVKQELPYMGMKVPIPTDSENWVAKYDNELLYVYNKDYNSQFGQIEYGLIPMNSTTKFSGVYDLKNQLLSKIMVSLYYHGGGAYKYRSVAITGDNSCEELINENLLCSTRSQRFVDVTNNLEDGYYEPYSRYYYVTDGNKYWILYGIGPKSKEEYVNNLLDMLTKNVSFIGKNVEYEFYLPGIDIEKTEKLGNIKIPIPKNLEKVQNLAFKTTDDISMPLAGTILYFGSVPKNPNKTLENYTTAAMSMYAVLLNEERALDNISKIGNVSNFNFSQNSFETINSGETYFVKGKFTYDDPELLAMSPCGNLTGVMGYITEIGGQDICILATYTPYNEEYVKKYVDLIYNSIQ